MVTAAKRTRAKVPASPPGTVGNHRFAIFDNVAQKFLVSGHRWSAEPKQGDLMLFATRAEAEERMTKKGFWIHAYLVVTVLASAKGASMTLPRLISESTTLEAWSDLAARIDARAQESFAIAALNKITDSLRSHTWGKAEGFLVAAGMIRDTALTGNGRLRRPVGRPKKARPDAG